MLGALLGASVPFVLERCNLGKRIRYLNAFAGGEETHRSNTCRLFYFAPTLIMCLAHCYAFLPFHLRCTLSPAPITLLFRLVSGLARA